MNTINLKLKKEEHKRKGFGASDFGKIGFDIYHSFLDTPETNPAVWTDSLKWAAGKGVELQMVQVLKDNGIVAEDFNQAEEQTYTMERLGVPVRITSPGSSVMCVEIKLTSAAGLKIIWFVLEFWRNWPFWNS